MFQAIRHPWRGVWLLAGMGMTGLVPAETCGQFLLTDSFTYTAGESMSGKNGGTSWGSASWQNAWTAVNGTTVFNVDLSYHRGDIHVDGGGRAVRVSNADNVNNMTRSFTEQSGGNPIYFSLLFRTDTDTDADDFIQFILNDDNTSLTSHNNSAGIGDVDVGGVNLGSRIGLTNGGTTQNAMAYQKNVTYLLVAKVEDLVPAGTAVSNGTEGANEPDRITLWINPTTFDENNPMADAVLVNDLATGTFTHFDWFTLRTLNLDPGVDFYFFDELRIGSSFASVVPEPGSAALLALPAIALLKRRRRSAEQKPMVYSPSW